MIKFSRTRSQPRNQLRCAIAAAVLAVANCTTATAAEVNVYSYREPQLVEPLLKAFTERTGIKARLIFAKDGLVERMAAEGHLSPADVLLTTDIARLTEAKALGLTEPFTGDERRRVAPPLQDTDGHWTAVTLRARVLFASKERVKDTAIRYAELADPKWKGRICSRSGQHPYNTALIAAMIAHLGEGGAETWLKGVKANLAQRPAGGDREQVRDVWAGKCDLALGNTYYMGLMLTNEKVPEQKKWADAVRVIFPDAGGQGTHVNISGVALARHAPNKAAAQQLIAFLLGDAAQSLYADINHEYPVSANVAPSDLLRSLGPLKPDALPLAEISRLRKKASELVDKVNFDAGPSS
ncbi:MAG: extracellular solute-binding protein [Hyphomicrobiaceae bacterium]